MVALMETQHPNIAPNYRAIVTTFRSATLDVAETRLVDGFGNEIETRYFDDEQSAMRYAYQKADRVEMESM